MAGAGEADQTDRDPEARRLRGERDRDRAERGAEHRKLARAARAGAVGGPARAEPAAADRADVGDQIDRDERRPELAQREMEAAREEGGQPEQEGPPDRIDQEAPGNIGPGLAYAE